MTTTAGARLRNWAGNIDFSTTQVHRPTTVEQLQTLVADTPRIRALGSGHSFNRIADTTGDLVSVAELQGGVEIDDATRTVLVPAGVRYGELVGPLQEHGWALGNLGSLPHITVGGATATGTHGSGFGNKCLATEVVELEFVRADGQLVRIAEGDPRFAGAVLSLGALGIVTRLRLALRPTYDLRQDVWLDASLEAVLGDLDAVLGAGYSVSVFSHWNKPGRLDQIWIKARAEAPVVDGTRWGAHPATHAQHPIIGVDGATATQQLGQTGPWSARLPHFRLEFTPSNGDEQQTEFFVAREHGAAALEALSRLDLHPALMVNEVRAIAADELWLSPFHGRDTVALHFTWVNDDALAQPAVRRVEQALAPFDARPHWGKVFTMGREQVQSHYPKLPDFRALAAENDPQRRFGNAYLDTFVYD